jgi:integrase
MRGSTFQRCGCRDTDGKQLGARCPRLGHKGHGTWWFRYDAPRDADGRRRQVKVGPFDSRRDAEAAMAAVLDRINKGTHVESDRGLTFSRYDEWLAGKLKLKQSTRTGYAHHIELYFKPGLGHVRLADLRDTDFEELYGAIRQIGRRQIGKPSPMLRRLLEARTDTKQARRPVTPNSVHSIHATAMTALNTAVKRHKLARNPALYVELERTPKRRALIWTEERVALWRRIGKRPSPVMVWTPVQTGAFLDAVSDDRLYPLWHLITFRGMRRSEAVWLAWSDVDLTAGTATVRTDDESDWDGPKSHTSERSVVLDPGTLEVLREHAGHRTKLGSSGARAGPRPDSSSPTRTDARSRPTGCPSASTGCSSATTCRRSGSRPSTRIGNARADGRRRHQGCVRAARSLHDADHPRHLHERDAAGRPGSRGRGCRPSPASDQEDRRPQFCARHVPTSGHSGY